MKKIIIKEYSTFFRVPKLDNVNYSGLLQNLSSSNYFTKEPIPYGYEVSDKSYSLLRIPKGIIYNALRKQDVHVEFERQSDFTCKKAHKFTMKNKPKNEIQEKVIKSMLDNFLISKESRGVISLEMGLGKTYVATNLIHQLQVKAIIMVKSVKLRDQWYESFKTHTTIKEENIYCPEGSMELADLCDTNDFNPDIIICTHKSMTSFMDRFGKKKFSMLLIKLGIGMKIFDEFDLENASMFSMDLNSSVKYNLYLSATTFKSDKSENFVFQRIFSDVYNIGEEFTSGAKRYGKFILFNSKPGRKDIAKCMQYSPDGMVFSYPKFHARLTTHFPFSKELKELWDNELKEKFDNNLKIAFYIGRKTTANQFREKLAELLGVDEKDIGIVNSDNVKYRSKEEKKNLIVTTSQSFGRGVDIKGLDTLVDFETRNSKSTTSQLIGRVSRTGMKNAGTYIQFVDYGFETPRRNYENKMRYKFFDRFFTEIDVIDKT